MCFNNSVTFFQFFFSSSLFKPPAPSVHVFSVLKWIPFSCFHFILFVSVAFVSSPGHFFRSTERFISVWMLVELGSRRGREGESEKGRKRAGERVETRERERDREKTAAFHSRCHRCRRCFHCCRCRRFYFPLLVYFVHSLLMNAEDHVLNRFAVLCHFIRNAYDWVDEKLRRYAVNGQKHLQALGEQSK